MRGSILGMILGGGQELAPKETLGLGRELAL